MKPEPKATEVVCTCCGLDWEKHRQGRPSKNSKAAVTNADCVRLLKAELAARPRIGVYSQMVPLANNFSSSVGIPVSQNATVVKGMN